LYPTGATCYKDTMPKRSMLHKELVRRSERMLAHVNNLWDGTAFQDVLFTWAGEVVKDDKGNPVNDIVGCDLPDDRARHNDIALKMAMRTSACGLLRIRREDECIKAIMETPHGSRSWTFPLHLRGDRRVVGSPVVREDEDYVGILWRKDMGRG